MKILILGHYEIASNYAISLLVSELIKQSDFEIRVALSGKGDQAFASHAKQKNDQSFESLALLEQNLCNELNSGIDRLNLKVKGFNQIQTLLNKTIEILDKPNSKSGLETIRQWAPNLIVSIRYRKIFHAKAISIPSLGIINLHSGLLPSYRGVMASFWSMLNQERNFGTTLHYISDASIDTGAIIQLNKHTLNYQQSYLENLLGLYPNGVDSILKAINTLKLNIGLDEQMPNNKGNYYSFPSQSDLDLFKNNKNRLF